MISFKARFNYYGIQFWDVGEDDSFALRGQAGAYRNHLKIGHSLRATQGIIGEVIRTGRSYLSNDVTADSHYTNLSLPIDTQSELSVPVLRDGKVVATLNVESDRKDAFDEDDVITFEAVASQVAVAMMNQKSLLGSHKLQ